MSTQLLRIIYFMAMSLFIELSTRWVWKAACHSSLKYEDEVFGYQLKEAGRKMSSVSNWLIDTSPVPYKTMLLVYLPSPFKILSAIGGMISIIGYVSDISYLNHFLNVIGVICGVFVALMVLSGIIYNKFAERNILENIKNRGITDYNSQMLANYSANWKSGKYKNRFVFRVSSIPAYAFICIWLAGLVFFMYMFVTDKVIKDGRLIDREDSYGTQTYATQAQLVPDKNEYENADDKLKELIEVLGEKGYRVFYDDTPGVALYQNVVERISADKSNDCVMDIYCLKDNDSAEEFIGMWLKNVSEAEKEQVNNYLGYTYKLITHEKDKNGNLSEEIRYNLIVCCENYAGYINCAEESLEEVKTILKKIFL